MAAYDLMIYVHILLFVFWLGGDLGVFILGQHFRKTDYSLQERLTILKLLVITDMGPRTAWALMVPVSLSLARLGGWLAMPISVVALAWLIGAAWLFLVWAAHLNDQTPKATRLRKIEFWLKIGLTIFYLWLGGSSLLSGAPIAQGWLATKALMFGLIFAAAIMIDVVFKPLGPALGRLINEGSNDETEAGVMAIMNRTRLWVQIVYLLLFATAFLGTTKPF